MDKKKNKIFIKKDKNFKNIKKNTIKVKKNPEIKSNNSEIKLDRVQKIISNAGYCSRRKAEELIEQGKVMVNNIKITLGDKASKNDTIKVEGNTIKSKLKKIYIILNKPKGFITTTFDLFRRKKVLDLVNINERIYPVGRLDRDSEGLLLLTNDGDFANKIMHPSYEIKKVYYVKLNKPLKEEHKSKIESGIKFKEGWTSKSEIEFLNPEKTLVNISLHEGKNKVVKRLFNTFRYNVDYLRRVMVGKLKLENVELGKWRYLTENEIKKIFEK
ncbi:pseudouridine synthase [Nanoarchaeota archaeon]